MIRKIQLITLALLGMAIAAPVGQAGVDPLAQSILRARGLSASEVKAWTTGVCSHPTRPASCYLNAAQASGASAPKPVDPLGVSILRARGWSASRIYDWTQGACSDQVKPSSCYLTAAEARVASERLAESMGGSSYPQVRTGEGFSFKAPSYWSTATPPVRINRSLEVPARYLGSGTQAGAKTRINRSLEVPAQYLLPSEPVSVTTGSDGFDWQDAGIGAAFVAGLSMLGVAGFLAVRRRHGLAQLDA
jgi:hypothetical protein